MKFLAILIFSMSFKIGYAQASEFNGHTWEAPYSLSTPVNWGIERFLIPISFAPQIPYKGVEDIRFTPGWAKATSDEYWSYAFLWYLDGEIKIDTTIIESNLQHYYNGLNSANGSKASTPIITNFKEIATQGNDLKTFNGTITMLDYMSKKNILLNCKVHIKSSSNKTNTYLFFELSPKPFVHTIWQSLDNLWADFKYKR